MWGSTCTDWSATYGGQCGRVSTCRPHGLARRCRTMYIPDRPRGQPIARARRASAALAHRACPRRWHARGRLVPGPYPLDDPTADLDPPARCGRPLPESTASGVDIRSHAPSRMSPTGKPADHRHLGVAGAPTSPAGRALPRIVVAPGDHGGHPTPNYWPDYPWGFTGAPYYDVWQPMD